MNQIREAREEDEAAIRTLLADNTLIHQDLTSASLRAFVVIPAESDHRALAGVAGLETFVGERDGLLRSVAVSAALRGRGVGKNLVAAIEGKAGKLGVRRLWLLTTTAPDFFRRLAYQDTARREAPEAVQQSSQFKSLCPASAVCLSKWL